MRFFKTLAVALVIGAAPVLSFGAVGGIVSPGLGSGGTPNVQTVYPGSALKATLAALPNGTTLQLGDGLYTVTPSLLSSNLANGTTFTGATLASKTNVTIVGVRGQTIIDGSSAIGDLLYITNCSNLIFEGITFRGWTNHNYMTFPMGPGNAYLWAGVDVYRSEKVIFTNCRWERHADHGVIDLASYNNLGPPSTNQIFVRQCEFEDIGSYRTNFAGGAVISDGTSIVPTGWTIEYCDFKNVLRCVEPYDDNADGKIFLNCVVRNCTAFGMVDFFCGPAGSTNGHNVLVDGNIIENPTTLSYHGTNYTVGRPLPTIAMWPNGGRGWRFTRNSIRGGFYNGFQVANTASGLDDCQIIGNYVLQLDRGDSLGYAAFIGDGSDNTAALNSCRRLLIRDNVIYGTRAGGINIFGGQDITVDGNSFVDWTIFSDGTTSAYAGVRAGVAGYTVNKPVNIQIRNNQFLGINVATINHAIWIENSVASGQVLNNYARGILSKNNGVTNRSSTVTILGPEKRFYANVDFPSLPKGTVTTVTIPATGTTTNSLVSLFWPAQTTTAGNSTNMIFTAWGSNDVVYIRCHNVDQTSAVDPQNVRFTAVVRDGQGFQE